MKKTLVVSASYLLPAVAFAQQTIGGIMDTVKGLMDKVIPILITLALLYFIYGVGEYVLSAGDEGARKEGRDKIIYGVVALTAILAVWGLVAIVISTFGLSAGGTLQQNAIPTVVGF